MNANNDRGGLDMPTIQYQDTSLKIAWVRRIICQPESTQVMLALVHLPP